MKSNRINFREILFDAIMIIFGFLQAISAKNPWWFALFALAVVVRLILKKSGFWDDKPLWLINSLKFLLFSASVILAVLSISLLFGIMR